MRHHCPWCLEPLKRISDAGARCPCCDQPLQDDAGEWLRPVDIRYDDIVRVRRERFRRMLAGGAPVLGGLLLLVPFLHAGISPLIVVPLLVAAHLTLATVYLTRPGRRYLGHRRRFFSRWINRLTFLWVGGFGYGFTMIPLLGAGIGVMTYCGLTGLAHGYGLWSLDRERRRQGLTVWEKVVLLTLVSFSLIVVVGLILLIIGLGWTIHQVSNLFPGR